MKRLTLLLFLFAALLITLPQTVYAGAFEPDRPAADIFRAVCASCHGYDGSGDSGNYATWVDDTLSFDIRGKSPNVIVNFIRGGRGLVMPGFNKEEISDNEANALGTCINNGSCTGANIFPDPPSAATVWVQDEPPWFSPYVVNVATGATVKFVNRGQTWHTVTQGDFLLNPGADGTNSGLIGRGGKYFKTFTTSGAFNFYCMLHPFMQVQVCAGQNCSPPNNTDPTPAAAPTQAGVGELWVAAQFQDMNGTGKAVDQGVTTTPAYPDLSVTFDDFVKPGEIEVINLATYTITQNPTPATNPFNNPHYIWGRATGSEMVIDNYFDNYKSFLNGSTKAVTLSKLTWGTTASHTTSEFDGSPLWGPIQGDYAIQKLSPGTKVGSWSVGTMTRITAQDSAGHLGSMPHGIWAGGSNGTIIETANSRSNNATLFQGSSQVTCARPPVGGKGGFPLNAGITAAGSMFSTTNVGNPTTFSTSVTLNLGTLNARGKIQCGTTEDVPLPGEGAVQTPPSPDDKYMAISNGPYITILPLTALTFPAGSTCVGGTFTTTPAGRQLCSINTNSFGAHGVAWGQRAAGTGNGWRIYMAAKLTNFVAVFDLIENTNGTVSMSHPGDITLVKRNPTGVQTFPGVATTGGQGVTTRPLPTPWQ